MADCSEEKADATAISFNLGDISDTGNIIFDEMREADVSDEILVGILDNLTTANYAIIENPEASKILTDENSTEPKHFVTLTNE